MLRSVLCLAALLSASAFHHGGMLPLSRSSSPRLRAAQAHSRVQTRKQAMMPRMAFDMEALIQQVAVLTVGVLLTDG
eukprot:768495-Hanusia_phi.AAC.4